MLTPNDAELIRRDPGLPGLALLLDSEALSERLGHHQPHLRGSTLSCSYLRYKPGTNCLAGYQLEPADCRGSGAGPRHLYAKAFRSTAEPKLWKGASAKSPAVAQPIVLADEATSIRVFPEDERLEALSVLASAARGKLLRKLLPDRSDLWEATPAVLRYKPERRCVLQLDSSNGARAVVRCYSRTEFANSDSKPFRSTGSLCVPERIGRSRRHQLLAFDWAFGQPLSQLFDTGCEDQVERTGAALAELHLQDVHGLRYITRRSEEREIESAALGLAFLCPQLAERCIHLAHRLADRIVAAPPMVHPIHGDFYAEQVLVSDDEIVVLDFDEAVFGDPAADLGNFIAHLDWRCVSGQMNPGQVESLSAALLQGYRQTLAVPVERVELYRAAALLRLAHHPFRSRQVDWPQQTEGLIALAETKLPTVHGVSRRRTPDRICSTVSRIAVLDPFEVGTDPSLSFVAPALAPGKVAGRFSHLLSRLACAERRLTLRSIKTTRHKPGRRCLIEYGFGNSERPDAAAELTLIAKVHARRADLRSYRTQQALSEASFSARSGDGVVVAEPVGVIPDWHMWLQRKLEGERATQILLSERGVSLAPRIAEAIFKLHRCGLPMHRRHTPRDELDILNERLPKVTSVRDELRGSIQRLLEGCDRVVSRLPVDESSTIHRDFYPDQVLLSSGTTALLDLDLCCKGDPALDVGNFDAHLIEHALRQWNRPDALAPVQAAFLDRYTELAGKEVRPRIDAYAALTLVRHIYISTLFPERRHLTEQFIELSAERLDVRLKTATCHVARTASQEVFAHGPAN